MRAILALLSLVAVLLPAQLRAEGGGHIFAGTGEDGSDWVAVGRLELAGKAFCTGALIAPDLVLTAAHCLFDPATGRQIPADEIQFLAGWRDGRAAAYRRVRKALAHPEYDYTSEDSSERVRNDVALVRLQLPIRSATIRPYETAGRPLPGDQVGVVSYLRDRSEAPMLQEFCEVMDRQEGVLVLSCGVDFGASGSPVFSFESGAPRIVSVVSAKAEANGTPVSLGAPLEGPLRVLLKAIEEDDVRQPVTVGMRRAEGAKFIKP